MRGRRRAAGVAAAAVGLVLAVVAGGGPSEFARAGAVLTGGSPVAAPLEVGTTVSPGEVAAARAELPTLPVAADVDPAQRYDRDRRFGSWPSIGGGCTLDDAVLADELDDVVLEPAREGGPACDFRSGVLDGQRVDRDEVDVDHIVSLRLAWSSNAASWSDERRREFATDRRNLRAEMSSSNRGNGAWGPERSDPGGNRCRFAVRFVIVAADYGLTVTDARRDALGRLLDTCSR